MAQGTFAAFRGGNFWQGAAAVGFVSSLGGSAAGGLGITVFVGTVAITSAMGGLGAVIGGAKSSEDILFGIAAGAMIGALNFVEDEVQGKSLLDKAIQHAGFSPNASAANWSNDDIKNNIAKILPSLYNKAGSPSFEQMDVIANNPTIDGQANATGNNGSITSKGVVYIKTSTMDHINHLVSTAGHELIHMADYFSGRYQLWYSFGANIAKAFTESRAYGWEISMGSTYGGQGNWRHYNNISNNFKSSIFGQ